MSDDLRAALDSHPMGTDAWLGELDERVRAKSRHLRQPYIEWMERIRAALASPSPEPLRDALEGVIAYADADLPETFREAIHVIVDEALASPSPEPLDDAWKAVEEALPEGWCDLMVWHYDPEPGDHHEPGHYGAKTADPHRTELSGHPFEVYGYGPSPAAALQALAARLSEDS